MTVTDIDATRVRLRQTANAIGDNLLELDSDPNRALLATAVLQGDTARRWTETSHTIANLWTLLRRLVAVLDEADQVRGTRARLSADQEAQIDRLLLGSSIELEREEIPLSARGLTSGRETTTHCTPDKLLDVMSEAFERAKDVIFGVGAAWEQLVPRVRAVQSVIAETLAEADAESATAGDARALQARLDEIGDVLVVDPLAVDEATIAALETQTARLPMSPGDIETVRVQVQDGIERARRALAELASVVADAVTAHENTIEKIEPVDVPSPVPEHGLGRELDEIVALADQDKWRRACTRLDAWKARAAATLDAARACLEANQAPIAQRNELRGLLDAYRAMANARGLIEDPVAEALHTEAHEALYTAPTDLASAAALVRRYQAAVSGDDHGDDRRVPR
jgi:hypothetical protein